MAAGELAGGVDVGEHQRTAAVDRDAADPEEPGLARARRARELQDDRHGADGTGAPVPGPGGFRTDGARSAVAGGYRGGMGLTELPGRAVRRVDDLQVRRWWLAFPIGVFRKYGDDGGSALAALLTLHVFLGLLPLLVVVLTVLGTLLEGSERLRDAAIDSTLGQLPVIGERVAGDVGALQVGGPWVAVSILGLLWSATGIYHALQHALSQVWNVEGVHRQGFASRHLRALALFVLVFGAGIGTAFLPDLGAVPGAATAARLLVGAALLLGVFRLALSPVVPTGCLVPAAVLAGLVWHLLQRLGRWIVVEQLAGAEDLYGGIGFVVAALLWTNLLARTLVLANEWAVVAWRELWPRRIVQPPLTEADRRVLVALARNERRRPEEHIAVRFDPAADEPAPEPRGRPGTAT